ncbi:hypothetical protein [Butyrivibrio sp. NC3005]|uniref:hypothetical protein n=1 Tax=Butyrivibrio sp. NC3005 TaxID=1280685 RepID=UPI0012DE22F0|nr:hypothetical protein [Butyrivibrio sp. NC3005]
MKPCLAFTESEAERLFISAGRVESFVNNVYRVQSFNDAYMEFKALEKEMAETKAAITIRGQHKVERMVRSYFLETDVFFSHWRKTFGHIKKQRDIDIYKDMEKKYDTNQCYNLLHIMRDYIMHAGDIVHGTHVGNNDILLWAEADVLKNDLRKGNDNRKLLENLTDKRINLLELADDAYPLVMEIHELFMRELAKNADYNLKEECGYLLSLKSKTVPISADYWYAFSYTGPENVNVGITNAVRVSGYGFDYYRLDLQAYAELKAWLDSIETA